MRRRTFLAAMAMLAGCSGSDDGSNDETEQSTPDESTPTETPEPTPTPTEAPTEFVVRIIYDGEWQGSLSVTGGGSSDSRSIEGAGEQTIEIEREVDIISVNAQKQDDSSGELTVQILRNGEVAAESSTSAEYGVAQTSQSFV